MNVSKIHPDLQPAFEKLEASEEITVLVYPQKMDDQALGSFLQEKKEAGHIQYKPLPLAGCIVVIGPKQTLLQIAARKDVVQIRANPTLTV